MDTFERLIYQVFGINLVSSVANYKHMVAPQGINIEPD